MWSLSRLVASAVKSICPGFDFAYRLLVVILVCNFIIREKVLPFRPFDDLEILWHCSRNIIYV